MKIFIEVVLGTAAGVVVYLLIKKNKANAVYNKTIKSIWAKKGIIVCIVNGTLFCAPLLLFILYSTNIITTMFFSAISISALIIATIVFCAFLLPLLRKWSIGTIRMGDEYIELFDSKSNKRTAFKWIDIEWVMVSKSEKNAIQLFVDNRMIEIDGVSSPDEVDEMFHEKCPQKFGNNQT